MSMQFMDAVVLDQEDAVLHRLSLRVVAPDAWLQPGRIHMLGRSLRHCRWRCVRTAKDDSDVDLSWDVLQLSVRRQAVDLFAVRAHRNDVIAGVAEIAEHGMAVPLRT